MPKPKILAHFERLDPHLAERLGREGVGFVIDLPQWVNSERDILEFVASSPPFRASKITTRDLAKLCGAVHCEFMLNGWNEVSAIHSGKAQVLLSSLERDFPTAGIIVATRTHHIHPPLPGSTRMRLLPLSRSQRLEYIQTALGERAEDLTDQIDREPVLDELTRTPLILAEVTSIHKAGGRIPSTKMGVLADVLRLVEETEEHQGPLASNC